MSIESLPTVVLDTIPFQLDIPKLLKALRVREGTANEASLLHLAEEAQLTARPKAMLRLVFIAEKNSEFVMLDGRRLNSRILKINLDSVERAFPFIATCGVEIEDWSNSFSDLLLCYWADTIKELALRSATDFMINYLQKTYHTGPTSAMHPGSLDDWPLSAQPEVFALLGDPQESIGVRLTESFLMHPVKSVSGIRFQTERSFQSCQLCPRERCPSRSAPYEPELMERKYAPKPNA